MEQRIEQEGRNGKERREVNKVTTERITGRKE